MILSTILFFPGLKSLFNNDIHWQSQIEQRTFFWGRKEDCIKNGHVEYPLKFWQNIKYFTQYQ